MLNYFDLSECFPAKTAQNRLKRSLIEFDIFPLIRMLDWVWYLSFILYSCRGTNE